MENEAIERAKEHFGGLLERQMERVAAMKESSDFVDYGALDTIKIGLIGGDGIGPAITETARGVLARLLDDAGSEWEDRVSKYRGVDDRESGGAFAVNSG